MKVLFIGNSQMAVCKVPHMIKVMSESATADYPRIDPTAVLVGGGTLKTHWDAGETPKTPRGLIASEKWDYVVIQEIYRIDKQDFETYAARFDNAIRKTGAKTILFATAGVTNLFKQSCPPYPDAFTILNDIQISFSKKRKCLVAAAGYAWMKYLGLNPSNEQILGLYHNDKAHPGVKGSYIYACLLYAVITGKNPKGLAREFKNISDGFIISKKEAAKMQKIAWTQYLENCR